MIQAFLLLKITFILSLFLMPSLENLQSQTRPKKISKSKKRIVKKVKVKKRPKNIHRFRFTLGFGRARFIPAILNEVGPSWTKNSFIASTVDANTSPVVDLTTPENLKAWSFYSESDYTWKDRVTVGLKYYGINEAYGRDEPAFRYQIFGWLGVHYKVTPLKRSGAMKMSGMRIIQKTNDSTGGIFYSGLAPVAFAQVVDKGLRHDLEAVLTFLCRYSIHMGVLTENFDRTYTQYISKTFSAGDFLFQEKTPAVIGFGEMASSHKIKKVEMYFKFASSFFL